MKEDIKERLEKISRGEVPEGYKKSKVGIIPADWEGLKYRQIFRVSSGDGLSQKDMRNGPYPVYGGNGISGYHDKYNFKDSNLIIGRVGAHCGSIYLITGKHWVTDNALYIRNKYRNYNDEFMYYKLKYQNLNRYASQSAQPLISGTRIYSISTSLPPLTEQKKIAQILTTWDKGIELKKKLIEEKKVQKKGLMQRLLTGELRLPGFDGQWKEIRLGDMGKTFNGLRNKTAKDFGKGKAYIPYKNIFDNPKIDIKNLDYVNILDGENQNKVKYGDILFTTSSETPDEVGMSSVLLEEVSELYLNSFCFGFRLKDFEILLAEFARFFFRGDLFRRKVFKLAQGSTRFNLSKNEMMKLNIKLPPIQEQKSIAQILSTGDREIDLLQKEVDQLKLQKRGLMQLLLTGIVRVS